MGARWHRVRRWLGALLASTAGLCSLGAEAGSYYVSPTGSDAATGTSLSTPFKTLRKAASVVLPGDVIEVRAGTYAERLIISRPGSASAWITMRGYNGERPVLRGTKAGPTVYFYHDRCDESVIGNASGNADCQAMYWVLQGLEIRGAARGGSDGNAVKIDTPKVRLVGNRLCCSVADVVKLVRTANDVELLDNEIWQDRNITVPSTNAQAVDIVGADRTRVAGNLVHDVPDIGIYAKGNSRDTLIENNRLFNIGGNALMLGQSTDAYRLVDGPYETYNGLVRNNVVVNSTWACLAASSSQNARFYNNSCFNTGITTHGSILLSNESEISTPSQGIEIVDNIIHGSANRPVLRITSKAMADLHTLRMDRNIYYIGGADPKFQADELFGTVGSAQWRNTYTQLSGRVDSSLVADPRYASTTGAAALTLLAGSPAIDAGLTDTVTVPRDIAGVPRPQGGAADIGAYETAGTVSQQTLVLTLTGSGSVTLAGNGVPATVCTRSCSISLPTGSVLTLSAAPAAGSAFTGWSGACAGSAGCSVTLNASLGVGATFAAVTVDTTPPTVLSTTPAAEATGVGATATVSVSFSEPVDCKTVTSSSFTVSGVAGTVACQGSTATFAPTAGLAAGTRYTAQISATVRDLAGNALAAAKVWSFTTVAAGGAQFSFLAYGDSRAGNSCDGNAVHSSLVNRMVNEPASMVFHLGDMVVGYDKTTNWVQRGDCPADASKGSLKELIAPLQNKTPAAGLPTFFFPVVGNHDDSWGDGWYPDKFGNGFCDVFKPSQLVPNHTQQSYFADKTTRVQHFTDAQFQSLACSTTDRSVYSSYLYYSFDHQNVHFVVMRINSDYVGVDDCNSPCTDRTNYSEFYNQHQLDWLRYDLAQASARSNIQHIIVLMHAPMFTAAYDHKANVSWPTLSKEFSKYKVRMVLQGHNHVYERSYPIFASTAQPNGVRDDVNGTVYTTTGGGGSALSGFNGPNPLMAVQNAAYHYLRVDVNGPNISVKAVTPSGTVLDSYAR